MIAWIRERYAARDTAALRYAARDILLLRRSEIHLPAVGEIWGSESGSSISDVEGGFISTVFQ
ncbi:hypothetical protein CLV31_12030 [Algoriphagus aquaeductus]|uniref:Uncharacterized protein n=1 Tax=Algoriphagus aquaeductus TaxID=475299 RepID=A0A326RLG7_9BACT|nr:hypothetical protein CLV31_12030 [Algoriphagus aquaeductus]